MFFNSPEVIKSIEVHKRYWGPRHIDIVIDRFIEEAGEVIHELLKRRRNVQAGIPENRNLPELVGELADMFLCIEHLMEGLDPNPVTNSELTPMINIRAVKLVEKLSDRLGD